MFFLSEDINTPIEKETDIIPIIKNAFYKELLKKKLKSATEIGVGFGIADIVFYDLDQKVVQERIVSGLCKPLLSEDLIKTLLAFKPYEIVSVTYLMEKLPFSKERLKYKLLKFLKENNYVTKISSDKFRSNFNYCIGLNKVIAVEAKLNNWKRGLYQAYRYKWFSDESYLAIYSYGIKPAKEKIDLFKKLNVGLLEVKDSSVDVIFNPRPEAPYSEIMWALTFEYLFDLEQKENGELRSNKSLLERLKNFLPNFQEFSSRLTF